MWQTILVAAGFALLGFGLGVINAGAKKFWLTPIVMATYAAGLYWIIPLLETNGNTMLGLWVPVILILGAVGMIVGWCTGRGSRNRKAEVVARRAAEAEAAEAKATVEALRAEQERRQAAEVAPQPPAEE